MGKRTAQSVPEHFHDVSLFHDGRRNTPRKQGKVQESFEKREKLPTVPFLRDNWALIFWGKSMPNWTPFTFFQFKKIQVNK